MDREFVRDLVRLLALTAWLVAALALALFMLSACAAAGVTAGVVGPASPLPAAAPAGWNWSPLTVGVRPARYRAALPLVAGPGATNHCYALDTWGRTGSVAAQVATLPEGGCGHIWHSNVRPWPEGLWPACRSVAECKGLDVGLLARARPGGTVLLLNEPNNPDTAGSGWPVDAPTAARELRPVVARLRAAGLEAACCGVYVDRGDTLRAAAWMEAYRKAGGLRDLTHFHVFGLTSADARWALRFAEETWPGGLVVSEAGWTCPLKRVVQGIDAPRYRAVFTLWGDGGC